MSTPPSPYPGYPLPYATPHVSPRPWKWGRGLIGWLLFVAVAALLFTWLRQQRPVFQTIALSNFNQQLEQGNVSDITIDGDELTGRLILPRFIDGRMIQSYRTYVPTGSAGSWGFTEWLLAHSNRAVVRAEPNNSLLTNFIWPFIPWLLILLFIWFFVFRQIRAQSAPKQPMPVIVVNPEQRS